MQVLNQSYLWIGISLEFITKCFTMYLKKGWDVVFSVAQGFSSANPPSISHRKPRKITLTWSLACSSKLSAVCKSCISRSAVSHKGAARAKQWDKIRAGHFKDSMYGWEFRFTVTDRNNRLSEPSLRLEWYWSWIAKVSSVASMFFFWPSKSWMSNTASQARWNVV